MSARPVAMVIAETAFAAQDAAELVEVDYEPLDPVVTMRATRSSRRAATVAGGARQPRGRLARHRIPTRTPTRAEVERIIASAKHVARVTVTQQRLTARLHGAARRDRELRRRERQLPLARLLAERGRAARQHHRHHELAEGAAARHHRGRRRRVRHEDRRLSGIHRRSWSAPSSTKRPVHWMSTRSEAFLNDGQARDTVTEAELALDENGQLPRAARPPLRQSGRLYRLGRRQHPDAQFRALLPEHVRHPRDRHRRAVPVHQHRADLALSRRRPAGGELRAGARGRRGRAHHRHRPRQAAQEATSSRPRRSPTRPRSAPPTTPASSR